MNENNHLHGLLHMFLFGVIILGGMYLVLSHNPPIKVDPNVYVSSTPPDHTIDTSATSKMHVASNLLLIQLGAKTKATTANKSQGDNAVIMDKIKKDILALGVPKEKIKTSYYSVDPVKTSRKICVNYSWGSDCSYDYVTTGYKTTHKLMISVEDLSLGGKILDTATVAGANDIDDLLFTLKPGTKNAIQMQLLKNASAISKSRAQQIATGLGVSLGKPLSAKESVSYSYYPSYKSFEAVMATAAPGSTGSASTSLSSGQIEVSATVSTSFEIK